MARIVPADKTTMSSTGSLYEFLFIVFFCWVWCKLISFLPFSINEWNKLDPNIRNLDSPEMFCKKLLNFIRSSEKSIFNIYDPEGSKLLNRLRLGFSHLREHKFWHNFADTVDPLCSCPLETISTDDFFYAAKITYHFVQPLWMN